MQENQMSSYPIRLYDNRNDVLYIYLDSQYNAFADEEQPDIYVFRNDDDNRIVGFRILDFQHNKSNFKLLYPQYETLCNGELI